MSENNQAFSDEADESQRLRQISAEELGMILIQHWFWVAGLAGAHRAVLRNTSLKGADFSHADLARADLTGADLSEANLEKTHLEQAMSVSGARGLLVGLTLRRTGP